MVKWRRIKEAPIPDYLSEDGRWRIFKKTRVGWCVQEWNKSIEILFYAASFKDAKTWVENHVALQTAT